MEDKELKTVIKLCLDKRMNYTETRNYLLESGSYDSKEVIQVLQREYVKHKTKVSKISMILGLIMLTVFPLVRWYVEHDETGFETSYKPMIFGLVLMAMSFISFQRAKADARRQEEFN